MFLTLTRHDDYIAYMYSSRPMRVLMCMLLYNLPRPVQALLTFKESQSVDANDRSRLKDTRYRRRVHVYRSELCMNSEP